MAKRVLITDDSAFMRLTLRAILEKADYDVVGEAADGLEALEQYRKLNPDLVTMDLIMPNMDGFTALEQILELDPEAKIIVVSSMGQKKQIEKAITLGAKDFTVKPFKAERVVEALSKVEQRNKALIK